MARFVAGAALAVWLAVAVLVVVRLQTTGSAHPEARLGDLGGLLLPGILVGAVALVLVAAPRRLSVGWGALLLFSLAGVAAWVFLRHAAYRAVPWIDSALVTAAVWMTIGLALGVATLSLVALWRASGPDRVARGASRAADPRDTPESLVRQRFDDRNVPPGL